LFADIALEVLRQYLAKNPRIELSPSENGNGAPKVVISEEVNQAIKTARLLNEAESKDQVEA